MNRILLQAVLWLCFSLVAAGDVAYHYARLPERIATHFDAAGNPDQWSAKSQYVLTSSAIMAGILALFPFLQLLVHRLPGFLLNLPRREYWLAPEREGSTRRRLGDMVHGLGLVMFATMMSLNHLIMQANLDLSPKLGSWPWVILGVNMVGTTSVIAAYLWHFYRRS